MIRLILFFMMLHLSQHADDATKARAERIQIAKDLKAVECNYKPDGYECRYWTRVLANERAAAREAKK